VLSYSEILTKSRSAGKGRGKGREIVLRPLVLRQPKRQVEGKVEVEKEELHRSYKPQAPSRKPEAVRFR
jgi:hypothetical protein